MNHEVYKQAKHWAGEIAVGSSRCVSLAQGLADRDRRRLALLPRWRAVGDVMPTAGSHVFHARPAAAAWP
jgi:hypothetical protein